MDNRTRRITRFLVVIAGLAAMLFPAYGNPQYPAADGRSQTIGPFIQGGYQKYCLKDYGCIQYNEGGEALCWIYAIPYGDRKVKGIVRKLDQTYTDLYGLKLMDGNDRDIQDISLNDYRIRMADWNRDGCLDIVEEPVQAQGIHAKRKRIHLWDEKQGGYVLYLSGEEDGRPQEWMEAAENIFYEYRREDSGGECDIWQRFGSELRRTGAVRWDRNGSCAALDYSVVEFLNGKAEYREEHWNTRYDDEGMTDAGMRAQIKGFGDKIAEKYKECWKLKR